MNHLINKDFQSAQVGILVVEILPGWITFKKEILRDPSQSDS